MQFTSRLFVIANVHLYSFKGSVASFYDINSVKISPLYTEKKNESNSSFLQIPFLITNIYLEEKKDVSCWALFLDIEVSTECSLLRVF